MMIFSKNDTTSKNDVIQEKDTIFKNVDIYENGYIYEFDNFLKTIQLWMCLSLDTKIPSLTIT